MDKKQIVGLIGILVAAITAQFNDQVVSIALADVSGGLGIGYDDTTWLRSVYVTAEVVGMALAPSLGLIFSIRRFALFAIALSCGSTLLLPLFGGEVPLLLILRALEGLAAGFTIPLLLTVALRVLGPPIRLYGLAAYALTATFAPNVATALAALWTDVVGDWRFVFAEALPLCAVAGVLAWWGMKQEPAQWDRLKRFDWPGALLVLVGFGSLSIVFEQGDRLDWFNSPVIAVLTLAAAAGIAGFLVREPFAALPLVRFDLFRRRNVAYGLVALVLFLVISLAAGQVPLTFLEQVQGYKPLQAEWLTLEIAVSQLFLLPLTALLLDRPRIDSRWVSAVGLACILAACVMGAFLTPAWTRDQFLVLEGLQSVGAAFVILPLLMMTSNVIKPDEGPYASAMINMSRAVAESAGAWALALITRWRGGLHRVRIAEVLGADRLRLAQGLPVPGANSPALAPRGDLRGAGAAEALNRAVEAAVTTLTTIDTFLILGVVVIVLMLVLAFVPQRTYPPRFALASQ